MKIYILPCHKSFQPPSQPFIYPQENINYGIEQDFFLYLHKNKDLLTVTPSAADFHYLPIFWTRWHLNHNYGKDGINELQKEVNSSIIDENKTFTICQYDDGPLVRIGKTIQFLSSRKTKKGIDIPLLRNKLQKPLFKPKKKYLASFIGRISNHPLRKEMQADLSDSKEVYIQDGIVDTKKYINNILSSYICLSPRGYGGGSFRFYESMQLGVVPLLIGDIDTRPFKRFINWDNISYFAKNTKEIKRILISTNKTTLLRMGKEANEIYQHFLNFNNWCKYVIEELKNLT